MAIGDNSPVDLLEVIAEFGPNSKPSANALRESHNEIYGNSPIGSDLQDFTGLGRPEITSFNLQSKNATTITPEVFIVPNGESPPNGRNNIFTSIRYRYFKPSLELTPQEADFYDGSVSVTSFQNAGSSPNPYSGIVIDNLDPNSTYYIMAEYFNGFIDDPNDYRTTYDDQAASNITQGFIEVTTDSLPKLVTPTITNVELVDTFNGGYDITFEYTGEDPSTFKYNFYAPTQNNSQQSNASFVSINQNTTSNTVIARANTNYILSPGDSAFFEVKSQKTGFIDSDYSNKFEYQADPPSYSVTDSQTSANEGTTITFVTTTQNVSDGTTLFYTISGVSSSDVSVSLNGSFTINSGQGSVPVPIINDSLTEGSETLTFNVRTGSTSGTIVASNSTTINDTSTAPEPPEIIFANPFGNQVTYLVIAGGGGGGSHFAGGGGAGGFLQGTKNIGIGSNSQYFVKVGAGGTGGIYQNTTSFGEAGQNGTNSEFDDVIAIGGGGGGGRSNSGDQSGRDGGSGGGGGNQGFQSPGSGTSGQGNDGGAGFESGASSAGGGGGGRGAAGQAGSSEQGGEGGIGASTSITGTLTPYAGGGGGSPQNTSNPIAEGGIGGGGDGSRNGGDGQNGTANTGGGGGGGAGEGGNGGNGGSGIIVFRYPDNLTFVSSGPGLLTTSETSPESGFKVIQILQGQGNIYFDDGSAPPPPPPPVFAVPF